MIEYKFIANNLNDTKKLAKKFAQFMKTGGCVCLYGDIGAGKTAFCREVAKTLGVKEEITSPSFVILNEYKTGIVPIYHFDLYRLENEGVKSIFDELEEYTNSNVVTFIEWAQFSNLKTPFECINLQINYLDETKREFIFKTEFEKYNFLIKGMNNNENIML